MKLIDGRDLGRLLAERREPSENLGRWVQVFEQVCQTVGYAHSRGVIHRDLKPSNVMVGEFGEVQVMDWGLAKVLGEPERDTGDAGVGVAAGSGTPTTGETVAGEPKGSPAYMSPEQARGEWDRVGARSDVFGLGAILAVILTGEPPYPGDGFLRAIRRAGNADLGECHARLDACGADAELVALCKRCLSADQCDRPADGREVAEAVAAYRAGVEARARKAEADRAAAEAEAREQRKRRKVQLALALTLGLLALGGGAFAWWNEKAKRERAADEATQREKVDSARRQAQGLLLSATPFRQEYRFPAATDALRQASELAETFAPELLGAVNKAKADLELVVELDGVRMRRSMWVVTRPGGGYFDTAKAPGEYRRVFASRGLDVVADPDGVADRVAASAVRTELVSVLDDWAILETDATVRGRVLACVRRADSDSGVAPFRNPAVWEDKPALEALAAKADVARMSPGAVVAIADVLRARGANAAPLLRQSLALHPRDFLTAFTLGHHLPLRDPERLGAYRAACAIRPDHFTLLSNLGIALHAQGESKGGLHTLEECVKLDPASAGAHTMFGAALLEAGDYTRAAAALQKAIELEPRFATAHAFLGHARRELGEKSGAMTAYLKAIELGPNRADAYDGVGMIRQLERDYDGAIDAHRKAIELDPEYAAPHSHLGLALRAKGKVREAADSHTKAIELDPRSADAHYNLGTALQALTDYPGAIAAYSAAIRLDPKHSESLNNLASCYQLRMEYATAAATYRKAIKVSPGDLSPWYNLGACLHKLGDFRGAAEAFREAARIEPKDVDAQTGLGNSLRALKEYDGAVVAFRKAVALTPEDSNLHLWLGNTFSDKGDYRSAVTAFEEVIRLDSRNASAYTNLGNSHRALKNHDAAVASHRKAVELAPRDPAMHGNLGASLAIKGEIDPAIAAIEQAIRLDPDYPEALSNLGRILQRRGRLTEALPLLRRGHELGSKRPDWTAPTAKWLAECERALAEQQARTAPPPRPKPPEVAPPPRPVGA